ncbi:MAG: site-specific DNA-methyltransferase, partial [Gammaproteobacteria bacterium]
MTKGNRGSRRTGRDVGTYRHEETKRKNNPEVGLANWEVKEKTPPRKRYEYDPHLDPQLVWTGKTERLSFDVDTVSLHIHERLSTQAIVNAVRKNGSKQEEDGRLDLFADPQLPLTEAVEFYQHDVDWANRLILGDSLLVMNSLLERELMAGQVQMVYLDPPYAVSYDSNFQPSTRTRDVMDGRDDSLTREPEQIRAYRDTWTFGVHSYLSYLRDRLLLTRELLSEAGSLFLQIGPDNLNLVALILDEVFGASNRMALINFRKKMMPLGSSGFESVGDYILWYCKNRDSAKTRELFLEQRVEGDVAWSWVELPKGERRRMGRDEIRDHSLLPKASRVFQPISLKPRQYRKNQDFDFEFEGAVYSPPSGSSWSTTLVGMRRLASARRLHPSGQESLRYVLFQDDYPVIRLTSMWTDTAPPQNMRYVVETNATVVARCMIAATDPGDLVFDPTCGSGTAAYVAEQWGRRWITCDTSRVALALARQRILTATYPYYQLAHPDQGVDAGFIYKSVPHVTLGSIANNPRIDEIPDDDPKHREKIEEIVQEYAPQETLYDRPIIETGKVRVSGPFSVESIPVAAIEDPSESPIESWEALDPDAREDDIARAGRGSGRDESTAFVLNLIEALKTSGINTLGGDVLRFSSVNPVRSAGIIQA